MRGWAVVASVFGSIVSLITILVFLWNIASNVAITNQVVAENSKLVKANTLALEKKTAWIQDISTKVDKIIEFNEDVLVVTYVNGDHMILKVPPGYQKDYVKVHIFPDEILSTNSNYNTYKKKPRDE